MKKRRGISLTEVIIVTVVVSIVAGIAVPAYLKSSEQSRENKAAVTLRALRTAQEQLFVKNRVYATDIADLGFDPTQSDDFNYAISGVTSTEYTISATRVGGPSYSLSVNQDGNLTNWVDNTAISIGQDK